MAGIPRSKKYELEWAIGDPELQKQVIEQINEMFEDLFADLRGGALFPVDLASEDDISGILDVPHGGTGEEEFVTGDLLYAAAPTDIEGLADVATGNALLSGGVGAAPAYGKVGLTTHVSGVLPIANGGTNGSDTPTDGGIAYGDGTQFRFTGQGTEGQVLTSHGASAPDWEDASSLGYWSPLTNGDPDNPEPIYDGDGDMIAVWTET